MNDIEKTGTSELVAQDDIKARIITVRGTQVILDRDVAEFYGVPTKVLNQAVKRNINRFPDRFMFQLTKEELENWRSQIVTSTTSGEIDLTVWRSQSVTSNYAKKGLRYRPYAFTEHGIMMLSSMLKSDTAVQVSVRIIDAFVAMRKMLASLTPLLSRIESTERRQLKQEDAQARNEERFKIIFDAMQDKKFPSQKVFFDGEFFDAFEQMKRFVRLAKSELIVIDPYFDDSVLALLAQKRPGVMVTVVQSTRGQRNLHAIDVAQFNQQYDNSLTVKVTDKFHDRFLVIDRKTLIHIGASLNYLGKKCFGFSTMAAEMIPDILARIP